MKLVNRWIRALAVGLLVVLSVGSLHRLRVKAQEPTQAGNGIAEVGTRFSGTLSLPKQGGSATPLHVELKEWHLAGQNKAITIPQKGFYVAELRFGAIQTEIGGKTQNRAPGDHWTVENGAVMIVRIRAPGEDAMLQTVSANPGQ